MSSANFKCVPLLNLLRFQGGELEERVFDAKFQDFMVAAKSDLEKAQTQKSQSTDLSCHDKCPATFLERKGFEATDAGFGLEVESRVSRKQIDFALIFPQNLMLKQCQTKSDGRRFSHFILPNRKIVSSCSSSRATMQICAKHKSKTF